MPCHDYEGFTTFIQTPSSSKVLPIMYAYSTVPTGRAHWAAGLHYLACIISQPHYPEHSKQKLSKTQHTDLYILYSFPAGFLHLAQTDYLTAHQKKIFQ